MPCVSAEPASVIAIRRLDPDLPLPTRAHPGDAGVDLCSVADLELPPGHRRLVGAGVAGAIPLGIGGANPPRLGFVSPPLLLVGLIHPRSGLAARTGLSIVNTPGTIDAGYRGEIKVCLINHDPDTPIAIARGDRIAQLVVQRVELPEFVEVDELDDTSRGSDGYGSSGGHAALEG